MPINTQYICNGCEKEIITKQDGIKPEGWLNITISTNDLSNSWSIYEYGIVCSKKCADQLIEKMKIKVLKKYYIGDSK